MIRKAWLLSALFAVMPVFAQDDAPAALSGGGAQVFTRVDAVNPMDQVKTFLAKANVTLNSDQEKTLRPAVEAAIKQLRELTERRRGGGEEIRKLNDDLMAKIADVLKPEQQAAFKKFQNDETKKAGGFGALKIVMQEAGAPLTVEQEPQIQGFYSEDAQQRQQILRESQGHPDPAKLADLQKATMAKVVKVLTPAQRKALLDSRTKQQ
jgi:murein DD-endopeptidase MepM/ murein hydrolase activator NlpD